MGKTLVDTTKKINICYTIDWSTDERIKAQDFTNCLRLKSRKVMSNDTF